MIALTGGSLIFLAFVIVFVAVIVWSLYTRRGSGIGQHPYQQVYGNAPGAAHKSELSGSDAVAQRRLREGGRRSGRTRPEDEASG